MSTYLKQPTPWSCYPTAASILTGIPLDVLIKEIGHDGSKIVNRKRDWPGCYETFTSSGVAIALMKLGWTTTVLLAAIDVEGRPPSGYPDFDELQHFIQKACSTVIIVIRRKCGLEHALAWFPKAGKLIDPLIGEEIWESKEDIVYFELLFRQPALLNEYQYTQRIGKKNEVSTS